MKSFSEQIESRVAGRSEGCVRVKVLYAEAWQRHGKLA